MLRSLGPAATHVLGEERNGHAQVFTEAEARSEIH